VPLRKQLREACPEGNACSWASCKLSHPLGMRRHGMNKCRDDDDCVDPDCMNKHKSGLERKGLWHVRRSYRHETVEA
jgi:hypothetical protein